MSLKAVFERLATKTFSHKAKFYAEAIICMLISRKFLIKNLPKLNYFSEDNSSIELALHPDDLLVKMSSSLLNPSQNFLTKRIHFSAIDKLKLVFQKGNHVAANFLKT